MNFTKEHAAYVQKLRAEGYSWAKVESVFNEIYTTSVSHDYLRQNTKRFGSTTKTTTVVETVETDDLPEYLLYEPRTYPKPKVTKAAGTALIIPDCHIPYHDQRAYELMLKVAQEVPDLREIVILGDYADFYAVSSHGKHPAYNHVLADEVSQVRRELERLRKLFPKTKIVFISGNHEFRLERYIQNMAPDLFGVVDTPTILQLDKLGIEFVPYNHNQKYKVLGSKLFARHEPIGGGEHAANSTVNKAGCSVVFGHIHRIQQYRKVFIDGADHIGASVGWLGDKDHEVMGYLKSHAQWQLGFGLATVLSNGNFFLDTKHIVDYTTVHNGKVYKG